MHAHLDSTFSLTFTQTIKVLQEFDDDVTISALDTAKSAIKYTMLPEEEGSTGQTQHTQQDTTDDKSENKDHKMARVIPVGEPRPFPHQHETLTQTNNTSVTLPPIVPSTATSTATMMTVPQMHTRTISKVVLNDTIAAIKRKQKVLDMKKFAGGGLHPLPITVLCLPL